MPYFVAFVTFTVAFFFIVGRRITCRRLFLLAAGGLLLVYLPSLYSELQRSDHIVPARDAHGEILRDGHGEAVYGFRVLQGYKQESNRESGAVLLGYTIILAALLRGVVNFTSSSGRTSSIPPDLPHGPSCRSAFSKRYEPGRIGNTSFQGIFPPYSCYLCARFIPTVKLIFRYRDAVERDGQIFSAEHMWVKISECGEGYLVGTLDNDPQCTSLLREGDIIRFHPKPHRTLLGIVREFRCGFCV